MNIGKRTPRTTAIIAFAATLSGCAISTPFEGPGYDSLDGVTAAHTGTVYVSITRADFKRGSSARSEFWGHVNRVEDSLADQPGFIGFSKRREIFGNTAWTMTVWTDRSSMRRFVSSDAHRDAMASSARTLDDAGFHGFEISAENVPIAWSEALQRLAEEPRPLVRTAARRD